MCIDVTPRRLTHQYSDADANSVPKPAQISRWFRPADLLDETTGVDGDGAYAAELRLSWPHWDLRSHSGNWLGQSVARISGEILVWLFPDYSVRGEVGPFALPVIFENLFNWLFKTQVPL